MQCKYCGGNISLEDLKCPYCGKPNEQAAEHAKDMQKYRREFTRTKKSVGEAARRHAGIAVRVVMLSMLVVAAFICFILSDRSYSIVRSLKEKNAQDNAAEYKAVLDGYLEDADYEAFSNFISEKAISTYDGAYEQYYAIGRTADYYVYSYEHLMQLANPSPYLDISDNVGYLCDYLESFYDTFDAEEHFYASFEEIEGDRNELCESARQEMAYRMKCLLVRFAGLTTDEAQSFSSLTKTRKMLLIEDNIENMTDE